jgi:hypothetical protein
MPDQAGERTISPRSCRLLTSLRGTMWSMSKSLASVVATPSYGDTLSVYDQFRKVNEKS